MQEATGPKCPGEFGDGPRGMQHVLQYGIAFDGTNRIVGKGKRLNVCNEINTREWAEVDIDE